VRYIKHNRGGGHFEVYGFDGVFYATNENEFAKGLKKLLNKYNLDVDVEQVISSIKEYDDCNINTLVSEIIFLENEKGRKINILKKEITKIEHETRQEVSRKRKLLNQIRSDAI
jgi:glucuronate isomerase